MKLTAQKINVKYSYWKFTDFTPCCPDSRILQVEFIGEQAKPKIKYKYCPFCGKETDITIDEKIKETEITRNV